jgi:hypothetical protein
MAHKVLDASFDCRQALERCLREVEADGCNVVALGEIDAPRLIVRRGQMRCEHQVVAVTGRDKATVEKILRQREGDGWVVCGLGPCSDATVMILKRALGPIDK